MKFNSEVCEVYRVWALLAVEEYLDLHEWQVQAIQEGIEAVNRNETESMENVKEYWENI